MHPLFNISEDTTLFPWSKRTPWPGVVAVLAVGIALLVGWLTGHKSAGAIAAGSDYLVIGRPIMEAADPKAAAEAVVAEIGPALAA